MRVFILGAADPEMEEIKEVLSSAGELYRQATFRGVPVRAEVAYQADGIDGASLPAGHEIIFVECSVMGLSYVDLVDHHRPGDPGYGMPADRYLEGSSLGQVLAMLGKAPTARQRVIAAADHCPTQAYKGACPGVDVAELTAWRTFSRAVRRGISMPEMEQRIEHARRVLEDAERIEVAGQPVAWVQGRDFEVTEASARFGIPFMYAEPSWSGKMKMGIMGAAPDVISAWMRDCGLDDVYGDPTRGYAGGYCTA